VTRSNPSVLIRFACIIALGLIFGVVGCFMPPPGDCGDNTNDNAGPTAKLTCVGCHTDEALLQTVAEDGEAPLPDTGEG